MHGRLTHSQYRTPFGHPICRIPTVRLRYNIFEFFSITENSERDRTSIELGISFERTFVRPSVRSSILLVQPTILFIQHLSLFSAPGTFARTATPRGLAAPWAKLVSSPRSNSCCPLSYPAPQVFLSEPAGQRSPRIAIAQPRPAEPYRIERRVCSGSLYRSRYSRKIISPDILRLLHVFLIYYLFL